MKIYKRLYSLEDDSSARKYGSDDDNDYQFNTDALTTKFEPWLTAKSTVATTATTTERNWQEGHLLRPS